MKKNIFRTFLIVFGILIQTSFLAIIFPKFFVPSIIIAITIAWTLIVTFENIWLWLLFLGISFDLITFSLIGKNTIFLILIAYFVSFLSRRFLMESKISGFLVINFFIFVATIGNNIWNIWMSKNSMDLEFFMNKNILIQFLSNIIIFYLIYWIINKIEKRIQFYEGKIKI